MRNLYGDLIYALRALRRSPLLVFVTVLSLGLGIGAATSVYTVANALLFRPPGEYHEPERLVSLYTSELDGSVYGPLSFPDYESVLEAVPALEGVVAIGLDGLILGEREAGELLLVEAVTGNYFDVLGVRPVLGRGFVPEETVVGSAEPVVVLGHDFWRDHFGGDPDVLGETVRLNGKMFTVIGVAPKKLTSRMLALKPDLWVPLGVSGAGSRRTVRELENRRDRNYRVLGRLASGASLDQAQAQLSVLGARLLDEHPEAWQDEKERSRAFTVLSERESRVNPDARIVLGFIALFLLVATGLVLLIGCSNVASLFLARAYDRRREMAIRVSLGAGRRRLVAMLLTESLVPGLAGGLLGIGIALVAMRAVASISLPVGVPVSFDIGVDARVVLFALILAVGASLVFGLAPALQSAAPDLSTALKSSRDAGGRRGGRFGLRNLLVVAQVGASVVLLVGAGLFMRGLQGALETDLGFNPDGVAMMTRSLSEDDYTPEAGLDCYRQLIEQLRAVPGVVEAAIGRTVEVSFVPSWEADVVSSDGVGGEPVRAYYNSVTPGYFEMLEVQLLRGRTIGSEDGSGALPVAVVNETLAERLWPGDDVIGKRFTVSRRDGPGGPTSQPPISLEVVGLAREGKYRDIDDGPLPYFWRSFDQDYAQDVAVLIKGAGGAEEMVEVLRREVEVGDRELTLITPSTYASQVDVQYLVPRLTSKIFAFGGLFGLILSVVGVYGLVSFAVSRRTHEMALRLAFGARADQVLTRVVRDGMRLVLIGLVGGLVVVTALARVARILLYGVSPVDPAALATGTTVILVAALAACVIPALRATRIDPMATLREE